MGEWQGRTRAQLVPTLQDEEAHPPAELEEQDCLGVIQSSTDQAATEANRYDDCRDIRPGHSQISFMRTVMPCFPAWAQIALSRKTAARFPNEASAHPDFAALLTLAFCALL